MTANMQVLLASRPSGWVTEKNFKIVSTPVPKPAEGQILVRIHYGQGDRRVYRVRREWTAAATPDKGAPCAAS